ncbi:MAG: sigma-70 family RNA polymerase sigma factor [Eubacteriales bacterium]|nr:sigma-70 family RNA polymerase sigma factor [Eubacteriales bacterium]
MGFTSKNMIKTKEFEKHKKVEELILSSYEEMYRLAYSYVGNEQDALDVVQESTYKCLCNTKQIRQEKYIKTWVWRIVINTAIDFSRKRAKEIEIDGKLCECVAKEDTSEDREGIYEALLILEEHEKSIIILYYFEQFKIREIAEIMQMNVNTVKSVLYRSLKKLKLELKKGDMVI